VENRPLIPDSYEGLRVTVMGLGSFGGGLGAVQFLLDRGALVTLTDLRSAEQLNSSLAQIAIDSLANLVLGEHREQDFLDTDLIVVNPAVKPGNLYLGLSHSHGVPLTTEVNLFWQHCRGKKLIVTGTVGKSTTATLIHQGLRAARLTARLGGNIGVSLLPVVDEIQPDDWTVLELSSFQLDALRALSPQPDIAVITNFSPNHLDWHGELSHYRSAKQVAVQFQSPDQFAFMRANDESTTWTTQAQRVLVHQDTLRPNQVADLAPHLRYKHQTQNAAMAWAVLDKALGLPWEQVAPAFSQFQGLPHRMELVGDTPGPAGPRQEQGPAGPRQEQGPAGPRQRQGVRWINDSKATTPEAAIAAIQAVDKPICLIAGGKDKHVDLDHLANTIADKCDHVLLMGDTSKTLAALIAEFNANLPVTIVPSLENAVRTAHEISEPGMTVLLSPGCASHDAFLNFEHRGTMFRQCVENLHK